MIILHLGKKTLIYHSESYPPYHRNNYPYHNNVKSPICFSLITTVRVGALIKGTSQHSGQWTSQQSEQWTSQHSGQWASHVDQLSLWTVDQSVDLE